MNRREISSAIMGKLLSIGALVEREGNRLLAPFNLNEQQFSILFEISRVGKVKQKDIVNRLLLERSHLSKVVKKLHSMGLISLEPTEDDKRSSLLSLTPNGEEVLNACLPILSEDSLKRFDGYDEKKLQAFLDCVAELEKCFRS